ncbi:MAG: dihydroorotate dehydrogenase electron transfer subunit [Clostridiales bacterium]|nr:dihydroorotate dehydrogenase electron transfer subunit [Clostridiales bacterium]
MAVYQDDFPIVSAEKLSDTVFDFKVSCPQLASDAFPGQFIHVICSAEKLLRRPISICEIDKTNSTIRFVFEQRGEGTRLLSGKKAGDTLNILGPLGKGFTALYAYDSAVVVGGGIGVPPLLEVAKSFNGACDAILGFRNSEAAILIDDFFDVCGDVSVTTDDGSLGTHGFVTDVLRKRLENDPPQVIAACGPTIMLKNVAALAKMYNVDCYVSLEERMGCGVGACLVCACRTRDENGDIKHSHVCSDGPVFNAEEVAF